MWWDGSWGWGMGISMLFGFLLWGGIIALIIWVVVRLTRQGSAGSSGKTPLDILRERYARGEITKEQFEQMKKDLS